MKLAILHHKQDAWREISRADVVRALDCLRILAARPDNQKGA